jgi:nucleoside-diphosphate-sugar epimerase
MVRASVSERDGLFCALKGEAPFDAVVHCAGRASDVGPDRAFRSANYVGALNVAETVRRGWAGRLVHVSTTDVYGIRDFRDADEATPLCNNLRNPYPKYKILAERALRDLLPPERYVILRPGACWGAGDTTILPRVLEFLRRSRFLPFFGKWKGRNRWPLAHETNVARAAFLAAACDDAAGEAYNVVDSERTTIGQYYRMLVRACLPDRPRARDIALPFGAGWAVGVLGDLLTKVLRMDRPIFEPSLYGVYSVSSNLDFSVAKLRRLFQRHGERFVTRQEALRDLAA